MVRYAPPTPELIGGIPATYGLLFSCPKCRRATSRTKDELRKDWGEKSRVADVAKKFACSNCKAKGVRLAGARVELIRTRSGREIMLSKEKGPIDALVEAIAAVKPIGVVTHWKGSPGLSVAADEDDGDS